VAWIGRWDLTGSWGDWVCVCVRFADSPPAG
jgi:hypothetical protein